MNGLSDSSWWRRVRRALSWHRRLVAAGLAAGAVVLTVGAARPAPPPVEAVLVASRDLTGGLPLRDEDLAVEHLPSGAVPVGTLRPGAAVDGAVLAAPVRRGEPLTDVRLVGPGLLDGTADDPASQSDRDLVAAPVRVADAEAARLVRVGDRVDVLAADARAEGDRDEARVVGHAVRVLATPHRDDDRPFATASAGDPAGDGALLVVATTPTTAAQLARAAVTARLSFTLRGG